MLNQLQNGQAADTTAALATLAGGCPVLEAFLNTLDSQATKREYRRDVEIAMAALGDLSTLTAVELTRYRDACVSRLSDNAADHLSPNSVMRHLAALRSFLRFARLTGQVRLTDEVIRFALKSPRGVVIKPYQVLSDPERTRLLAAASRHARDRALLAVLAETGLRASELCALRVGDVVVDEEGDLLLHVRQGKGRKDRLVPLARRADDAVRAFLATRDMKIGRERDAGEYLFRSRQGAGRMTTVRLRQIIADYLERSGLTSKAISPHSLRHSAAVSWLRRGASIVAVQKLLGHASLSTTQRYVDHLGLRDLKQVVNREPAAV